MLRAELPVFDDEPVAQPSTKAAAGKSKVVAADVAEHATETPVRRAAFAPTPRRERRRDCSNYAAAAASRG